MRVDVVMRLVLVRRPPKKRHDSPRCSIGIGWHVVILTHVRGESKVYGVREG